MGKGNLPPEAQEDLEVTETDIWAALDAYYYRLPDMQPGDITTGMYAEHFRISDTAALKRMKQLELDEPDKWLMVKVRGSNGGRWVLRKR